ncbi:MAG: 2-phospho-L-lactate transferase CofD family protein [Acidimicrobiales bacterium]
MKSKLLARGPATGLPARGPRGALRVVALAGGVGAARMLSGLAAVVGQPAITAVINTGDDTVLHGLYVSPDIDTVTYTLAGVANPLTGWGLEDETWSVMGALRPFEAVAPAERSNLTWFNLGDRDLATHMFRTGRMAAGATLSTVTAEICRRFRVGARLLPMTDDRVETRVRVKDLPGRPNFGGSSGSSGSDGLDRFEGSGALHDLDRPDPAAGAASGPSTPESLVEVGFQEYFVGLRHSVEVKGIRFVGAAAAAPAPGVVEAIEEADILVVCPSNPIVSIGPVMAVPGIAEAVARRRESTVAVSPIVAGKALKGPADRMLAELGYEPTTVGVAELWAPIAGTLVVDYADAGTAPRVEARGMRCLVAPSVMSGPDEAANLARAVLSAGAVN